MSRKHNQEWLQWLHGRESFWISSWRKEPIKISSERVITLWAPHEVMMAKMCTEQVSCWVSQPEFLFQYVWGGWAWGFAYLTSIHVILLVLRITFREPLLLQSSPPWCRQKFPWTPGITLIYDIWIIYLIWTVSVAWMLMLYRPGSYAHLCILEQITWNERSKNPKRIF